MSTTTTTAATTARAQFLLAGARAPVDVRPVHLGRRAAAPQPGRRGGLFHEPVFFSTLSPAGCGWSCIRVCVDPASRRPELCLVESLRCRRKHANDQKADGDVIENVHGVVPIARRLARK
jgi:hypothetical protein